MIVQDAIRSISGRLRDAGLEDSVMESEFLVAAVLGLSRPHLVLRQTEQLSPQMEDSLRRWTADRAQRKPMAYVVGDQPFMDMSLAVNSDVLVPRPETELLAEKALRLLDQFEVSGIAVDVGTGSGNIALTLSQHPKISKVIGIDISLKALAVAKSNAVKYDLRGRCQWVLGDLLSPFLSHHAPVDLVIANLPYVRTGDIEHLEPELRWEPRIALDGGPDGLALIFRLITQAGQVLRPGGALLLEIGADQPEAIQKQLEDEEVWTSNQLFSDLAGHPRIIQTTRKR